MLDDFLEWFLGDFGVAMLLVATLMVLIHLMMRVRTVGFYEIVYRWFALLPLGATCVYAGFVHIAFPETSAALIGWEPSPFQFEVAMGDLGLGVLGIISFNSSFYFRLATVIMAAVQLWGDALGHLYQMVAHQNFDPGNAGSWFWMDLIIPAILILCLSKIRSARI